MVDLDVIIREIGYTQEWVELGIVDERFLTEQYAEFQSSGDRNQEHYRAAAFWAFLQRNSHVSDELVARVLRLQDSGPDNCDLTSERVVALIESRILTDAQHFGLATLYPIVQTAPIQRRYVRDGLRRKLEATGVAANFAELVEKSDAPIQLLVLTAQDLERGHVEWLARDGVNKAIRNKAAELLRSRRFSNGH